jgi:hypothetical protein
MAPDNKDKPGTDRNRKAARDEYEVAYYTKELGRPLQRKMLQKRLDDLSDRSITAASHGEEESLENRDSPPPDDRAG